MLPSISNYGNYSSDNYGAHTLVVSMLGIDVYFSYTTPVAFRTLETGLVVSENVWSRTTGKHLDWIDGGRKERVPHEEFQRLWKEHVEDRVHFFDKGERDTVLQVADDPS